MQFPKGGRLSGLLLLLTAATPASASGRLIILRHGASTWNVVNTFTGWEDVPLVPAGEVEAHEAAQLLLLEEPQLEIDVCYTSVLERAVATADICMAKYADARGHRPPLRTRWRLNERHYGSLQGLLKADAMRTMDPTSLQKWRGSFAGSPPPMDADHPYFSRSTERYERLASAAARAGEAPADADPEPLTPERVPLTESLADTVVRVRPLWERELRPAVRAGQTVLLVGHANCLRALAACIQPEIDDFTLPTVALPNALPLVYEFDDEGCVCDSEPERCYVKPLSAFYLGSACFAFKELDQDGSGAIDSEEWLAAMGDRAAIEDADSDGDGVVNFKEFMSWRAKQQGNEHPFAS